MTFHCMLEIWPSEEERSLPHTNKETKKAAEALNVYRDTVTVASLPGRGRKRKLPPES